MEEKTHFYGFVNDICDPFRTDILYFLSPYRAACFVSYRFDDVEMKCSNIDQAGCQLKQLYSMKFASFLFSLSFSILSTNLMLNRDKKKKKKKKKRRCELSVFLLYLFIHVHYLLLSMRMHLFKSIYAHTHEVTNMIIRRAHSMCQNYHIYFL